MSYCPKWVFEAACAHAAYEFLSRQIDLNTVSSGYAAVLSGFYQTINNAEVASVIEQMLRFLDDLDAGEAAAPLERLPCEHIGVLQQLDELDTLLSAQGVYLC